MCFAINRENYARWTVKYDENLLKLQESHPQVYEEFKKGWFSIKRTSKPFSGLPIDITLEQTINGEATCQKTGIGCYTNSISARQRWAENHFIRTEIISDRMDELSLNNKEDIIRDLKKGRLPTDSYYMFWKTEIIFAKSL